MNSPILPIPLRSQEEDRLFQAEYQQVCKRTDRLIALIMAAQWPGAIAASLLLSARTWEGSQSSLHPHVIAAIYLGGLITIPPILFALIRPGQRLTRHVMAACQMLMSALLIHISGGRIETHFHIFGSLAFLAFYLDWQVLITATIVILIDHSVMGYFHPASVFGTATASSWRFVEHVLWVVFCDAFLIMSCRQSLRALRVVSRREADQETLLHQAYHDTLTGLGNRLLLQKTIADTVGQPQASESPFALLAIDLDRFKEVNDTLGHQIGDEVLTEVSRRLKKEIRRNDTLVRMGGDEFALLLDGCSDRPTAERIAERIVESLNRPIHNGNHIIQVGVSIGICLHREAEVNLEALFHHADLALYKAKNNGRNTFSVFDEEMRIETLRQMGLEHRLRSAIQEQSLELNYQPIVNSEGNLLGFEALLRWNDPLYGSVSPVEFIPIAERTGLIIPLGSWVLQQACRQAAEWHRGNKRLVKMSVNISSLQLAHRNFVSMVLAALEETGLPPEMLDLELTESALIQNHGDTREALAMLHTFGVRLSIDDFGTGYSSLSYLRELPVHSLKIDRSFVRDILTSRHARLLVEGMIEMAHSLHLRVVAEGVESREQMSMLTGAGCDEIQGFHISRAIPAQDANRFLERDRREQEEPGIVCAPALGVLSAMPN